MAAIVSGNYRNLVAAEDSQVEFAHKKPYGCLRLYGGPRAHVSLPAGRYVPLDRRGLRRQGRIPGHMAVEFAHKKPYGCLRLYGVACSIERRSESRNAADSWAYGCSG